MFHQTKYFHNLYRSALLLMILIGGGFLLPGAITPTFAATPTPTTPPTATPLPTATSIPTPSFPETPVPPIVSGSVIPGFLTLVAGAYSFSGTPGSLITYPMPFEVDDLRGGLLGWNLSITSTQFSGTTPLPLDASLITGTTATCKTASTCSDADVPNAQGQINVVPAGATAPTQPSIFFTTGAGKGAGTYAVTSTISVFIPGGTQTGTYTSTVTLAILSGP